MRPTGRLHLGHLVGALENWVSLQDEYQNYHLIADYHALTTNPDTRGLYENSIELLIDWLAAGLDPARSPMFRQSQIKEHAELHLIFSMLITTARLERNPSLKEQVRDLELNSVVYGHLGYPVLQAADILLYKGDLVPVGEDQIPHVEISREIARRFNSQYAEVFPEPAGKVSKFPRLPGLDGKKMSKSLGNAILLSDGPDEVWARMRTAVTDPLKVRRNDPGRPDICLVFSYHQKFNPGELTEIRAGCESGSLGCVDCKKRCADRISETTAPLRERRAYFEQRRDAVKEILADGERRARGVAQSTMLEVHSAMALG
ncbi:MAG: tryptophan--tRNA ligase [Ignavibacteria bacterium GWA2_55_11]|nr:MAG: tryptophan--tRNA ligase [Ignavibacteria bacterium GWA2_55_11]OGU43576.1 MAG: tryptophan--tRNA ligase [Ignavibacteria bacterium GWC2_56_12]OGU66461.1 MAG: tryptophan--tRNA ligase [Ignavibacteria bacterium RIFCSPHIGHO2_02_FULL_56_12]OGU68906.1 MAG: tryptophan--tRNA ligase [Ignavibacteria bacterium RIFCSPLOWO2_02_FULL_55_14]OGU76299.1 MAG: tryptophan--tRNA ligase [Ignavibacteria bacterium RIFCSPLOWO2_12_FULL_56_21]